MATPSCSDGVVMNIAASDYEQSCRADSDCVSVPQGDLCLPCVPYCNTATVNRAAEAQYRADVADIVGQRDGVVCHCPAAILPCCMAGKCSADLACAMPRN